MRLTGIELRKIFRSRVVIAALLFLLAADFFVYGNTGNTWYAAFAKDSQTHIAQAQEDGLYFKGEITDQWISKVTSEADAIRNDPENQLQGEAREAVKQKLADQGFNYDTLEELYPAAFIKEEVLSSRKYTRYEPAESAAGFSEYARIQQDAAVSGVMSQYDGRKEEVLIAAAEEDYRSLAEDYVPVYDYKLGYGWMNNIMLCQHYILGLLLAVGLSGIFSDEYLKKMDAMIQVTVLGRRKTALAKVKAAFLFSVLSWALFMCVNLLLTTAVYGWEGWESYWQDWIIITSPFQWNQGEALMAGMGTSLVGVLFFASAVMMISAICKTPVTSLLISSALLIVPVVCEQYGEFRITAYFPASLMRGEYIWFTYRPVYLAGIAADEQLLILAAAIVFSAVCILATVRIFERHEISN